VAHHVDAGAGRGHDRVLSPAEGPQPAPGQGPGLVLEAGVEERLSTARLLGGELDLDTLALEQPHEVPQGGGRKVDRRGIVAHLSVRPGVEPVGVNRPSSLVCSQGAPSSHPARPGQASKRGT